MGRELAQLYNLEGVKEVNVRKVDKDEVGIDLLELKFKVQNLTITYVPFSIILLICTFQCCLLACLPQFDNWLLPIAFCKGRGSLPHPLPPCAQADIKNDIPLISGRELLGRMVKYTISVKYIILH